MRRKLDRNYYLYEALLALVVLLAGCGYEQPTQLSQQPALTAAPTHPATQTHTAFTPSGAAVWILSCLDGWEKQKIYQANPYYINQQGIKKARDLYVFGHFWLQPKTGEFWPYSDQPEMLSCLSNLIVTVRSQYHAQVCGVVGVNEAPGPGGWKPADVVAYTKRVVAHPALLTSIVDQARKYSYDCIINDIEDGDKAHPETFSQYDALLRSKLPIPLGQTLLWKTHRVSSSWQKWEDWKTLANNADFFIVMALDQDSIDDPPLPTSIVNEGWVKNLYAYMRSIPRLFGAHPVAWELPTYYRLFTHQPNGKWAVSSGTDVDAQIATALKSKTIPKNAEQDPRDPYLTYVNAQGQMTYLFFETARSSDVLAQTLTRANTSICLLLSFWDNDSGTSNSLGWSSILADKQVHLC
jgi:hypothetical protein